MNKTLWQYYAHTAATAITDRALEDLAMELAPRFPGEALAFLEPRALF